MSVCVSVTLSPPNPLDQSKNVTVRIFHIWPGSAQCSKGVKLTKLGIQSLVLQREVYIISDSQELKFLKLVIRKCIFYGPEVWCFTTFWPD